MEFDETGQLFLLGVRKTDLSHRLKDECRNIVQDMSVTMQRCNEILETFKKKSQVLERQKQLALSMRQAVHKETIEREKKKRALRQELDEKQNQLEKLNVELKSLVKVYQEQIQVVELLGSR